jgi:hypothetical protein
VQMMNRGETTGSRHSAKHSNNVNLRRCYALQAAERNRWRQYTSRDSQRINVSAWRDAAGRWRHSLGGMEVQCSNFTLWQISHLCCLARSSRVMGTVPSCSWEGLLRLGRVVSISALMSPMHGTRSRGSHKQRKCVHSSRPLDAAGVAHQHSALSQEVPKL